jgi:hypothetical protein
VRSSQMIIAAFGPRAPAASLVVGSPTQAIQLSDLLSDRLEAMSGDLRPRQRWEPKWEPKRTDTKPCQATSSQCHCRFTPYQAALGYFWQLGGADLGAGGRGFESRHPDW